MSRDVTAKAQVPPTVTMTPELVAWIEEYLSTPEHEWLPLAETFCALELYCDQVCVARRRAVCAAIGDLHPHTKEGSLTYVDEALVRDVVDAIDGAFFDGAIGNQLHAMGATLQIHFTAANNNTLAMFGTDCNLRHDLFINSEQLLRSCPTEATPALVGGIVCRNRVEMLVCAIEHELVHLIEAHMWPQSHHAEAHGQPFSVMAVAFFRQVSAYCSWDDVDCGSDRCQA